MCKTFGPQLLKGFIHTYVLKERNNNKKTNEIGHQSASQMKCNKLMNERMYEYESVCVCLW